MRVGVVMIVVSLSCSPMVYTDHVPNLAAVESNVYRSGQITDDIGWQYIEQLAAGRRVFDIKLNFDDEGSDSLALEHGFIVQNAAIDPSDNAWLSVFAAPDETKVSHALQTLALCKKYPLTYFCLVHCSHGQDRTGYVIGKHRVLNDGWSKHDAYEEMRRHNFHFELWGLQHAWDDWRP